MPNLVYVMIMLMQMIMSCSCHDHMQMLMSRSCHEHAHANVMLMQILVSVAVLIRARSPHSLSLGQPRLPAFDMLNFNLRSVAGVEALLNNVDSLPPLPASMDPGGLKYRKDVERIHARTPWSWPWTPESVEATTDAAAQPAVAAAAPAASRPVDQADPERTTEETQNFDCDSPPAKRQCRWPTGELFTITYVPPTASQIANMPSTSLL